jgi:integrase
MPLTDIACKTAKPKDRPYKIFDLGGLFLFVTPSGSKLWRMKYRFNKKEKGLALGGYPLVSLSEAREARDKARKLLMAGQDPSLLKQEQKRLASVSSANTFEAVAREWHAKNSKAGWNENHARTIMYRLERDVFPAIGNLPIKDIETPRIALTIETIDERGAHVTARRALQYCRAVFAYAKVHGKIQHNPADIRPKDILAPRKKGHFAALEGKDMPEFIGKLYRNEARLFRQTQLAMTLLMLTFVRTSELIKATWGELELEKRQWIIPGERMKMKRDHIVPLSRQSVEIFEELRKMNGHRRYIFPGQRNPQEHMSNNTILVALDRMGYRGIHTGHGFRALAMSTLMEELGVAHEIIDVQLAHGKKNDVDAAYNRAKFLKDRIEMMQRWADYIENLASSGKVIVGNFNKNTC